MRTEEERIKELSHKLEYQDNLGICENSGVNGINEAQAYQSATIALDFLSREIQALEHKVNEKNKLLEILESDIEYKKVEIQKLKEGNENPLDIKLTISGNIFKKPVREDYRINNGKGILTTRLSENLKLWTDTPTIGEKIKLLEDRIFKIEKPEREE